MAVSKCRVIKTLLKTGFTCTYCKKEITSHKDFTLDHVLPKSKGGKDTLKNLTTSCLTCNRNKADKLLTEFIKEENLTITPLIASFL